MRHFFRLISALCCPVAAVAQVSPAPRTPAPALTVDLSTPELSVSAGQLKVGGKNPQGVEINANSRFLTFAGKPWVPIMGEFHYLRYPREQWEEELLKMKAGGINVVSTYVFWIYHEEEEGKWNWSGNRDLRAFVELCGKHGLYVYPRIGPWAHGEVRNGALPDWVLKKCGKEVRKDAEPYLDYAREFYEQTAKQLNGLLWKDGGPVIGTQIENELTNNPQHLSTLKNLARAAGIDVPLYTITGWMRVRFPENEMLPVFGGYADAFWSRQTQGWARESRANYFFSHNRDDSTIGADLAKSGADRSSETVDRYPYGTVELGGGMQVSYRRRPVIQADDIAALAMVKLGSGSNMQGYYMYHGGANGLGLLSTLQESRASGYPNDLPVINYDFQAPLGEYGQRRASYDALRIQHLFLHDFGSKLASLPMVLPDQRPDNLDDRNTVRWSTRSDGEHGFLFVNNYQRIESLPKHDGVHFELKMKDEILKVPSQPVDIPAQSYFIWPVNLEMGGALLKYATAQLLCRIGDTTVFFTIDGIKPEFVFDEKTLSDAAQARITDIGPDGLIHLSTRTGSLVKILVLNQEQARQAYVADIWGAQRLFLSKAGLVFDGNRLRIQSRKPADMSCLVYPSPGALSLASKPEGVFTRVNGSVPEQKVAVQWKPTKQADPDVPARLDGKGVAIPPTDADFDQHAGVWQVSVPGGALANVHQAFLRVDYTGDVGRAYLGDQFIDDDFYFGRVWEIGLTRFAPEALEKGLTLKLLPLRKDSPIYIPEDCLPKFGSDGEALEVRGITVEAEYETEVHLRDALQLPSRVPTSDAVSPESSPGF